MAGNFETTEVKNLAFPVIFKKKNQMDKRDPSLISDHGGKMVQV